MQRVNIAVLQGVWADPTSKDVAKVFQAWAVLEQRHGTIQLARELCKCAIKADSQSEMSWAVSYIHCALLLGVVLLQIWKSHSWT